MLLPGVSGTMRFGYQPGNYRESTGQTLAAADQQVGLAVDASGSLGSELVTNGTGDDLTGWSVLYNTAPSIESGKFKLTNTVGGYGGISRPIVLEVGKTYRISVDYTHVNGSGFVTVASTANGTGTRLGTSSQLSASQTYTTVFTSTLKNCYICVSQGYTSTTGTVAYFDNISIRELPGIHASQPTSGYQPVLRNASGIQSWQFDGTDDRLSLSAVPFQMTDDHFVVTGVEVGAIGATRHVFTASGLENQRLANIAISNTGYPLAIWRDDSLTLAQVVSSTQVTAGAKIVLAAKKVGNTKSLLLDGVAAAPDNTTALGTATVTTGTGMIGTYLTSAAGSFNRHIHGIIFGKGAISDSELLTLERFIASLQGRTL